MALSQNDINEINQLIADYIGDNKTKVSQLPEASTLTGLWILGVSAGASVKASMALLQGLDGKSAEMRKTGSEIQWRVTGGTWAKLIDVDDIRGFKQMLQKTSTEIQTKYENEQQWQTLLTLSELKGDPFTYSDFTPEQINGLKVKGDPGANIELNISATHVQWRVVGSSTWINLIALSELKGTKGDDAKEVEFQKTATHIQWKRVGESWANLVLLSDLKGSKGDDGKEVQLQKTATHLQWRLEGGSWANIVALADLKGDTGAVPIISIGTVQTVAPGGQSSAEFVTDGLDPNGVQKYKLNLVLVQGATGTVANIETITVTFTEAETRANIATGETFATLFGKIKKWFADLGLLAFKNKVSWTTDIDDRPPIPSKVSDLTNDSGFLNESAVKSVKVDNASDADTVDGKTVAVNVPEGAKFTDTTYSPATISDDGLMSAADKTALNNAMPKSGGQLENYTEKLVTTTGTINLNDGNVFYRNATANTTFSITNPKSGAHSFTLFISMGATVRTLTFPASVKWDGGTIPDMTTASKMYILTFVTIDSGSNWYGMEGGKF